jgi:hypothetical protein
MSDAPDFPQMATPGTFLTEVAPDHAIPENPMTAIAAMRLAGEELAVEGFRSATWPPSSPPGWSRRRGG